MSWAKLTDDEQRQFARNCSYRRAAFVNFTKNFELPTTAEILIVGDRPGPKAPQTDNYHHTPFYSKIHSGGWINALLVKENIDETKLFWINSASWNGFDNSSMALQKKDWPMIIALGNNASKWLSRNDAKHEKVLHPQAHKRFHASEPYNLIQLIKSSIT